MKLRFAYETIRPGVCITRWFQFIIIIEARYAFALDGQLNFSFSCKSVIYAKDLYT